MNGGEKHFFDHNIKNTNNPKKLTTTQPQNSLGSFHATPSSRLLSAPPLRWSPEIPRRKSRRAPRSPAAQAAPAERSVGVGVWGLVVVVIFLLGLKAMQWWRKAIKRKIPSKFDCFLLWESLYIVSWQMQVNHMVFSRKSPR